MQAKALKKRLCSIRSSTKHNNTIEIIKTKSKSKRRSKPSGPTTSSQDAMSADAAVAPPSSKGSSPELLPDDSMGVGRLISCNRLMSIDQPHGRGEEFVACDPEEEVLSGFEVGCEDDFEPDEQPSHQADEQGDVGMPWEGRRYDEGAPCLGEDELNALDRRMEQKELNRLLDMGVLRNMGEEERAGKFKLQCRYVMDWRYRSGWVRRARLVAKEYRFLEPTLSDLYSPTSTSCSHKLLACMLVSCENLELLAVDITDAYLQVKQRRPTFIQTLLGDMELLYTLPGQRSGSRDWYDYLCDALSPSSLQPFPGNPSLFAKPQELALNSHVDDLQILGVKSKPGELADALKSRGLKLKVDGPVTLEGGVSHFLKRKFEQDLKGVKVTQDIKYSEHLISLLSLSKAHGKHTPMPQTIVPAGAGKVLDAAMHGLYRRCIGILLYLSAERPDLQYGVKVLSSRCSQPTMSDMGLLKHLVRYLKLYPVVPIYLEKCSPGRTLFQKWAHQDSMEQCDFKTFPSGAEHVVEVVTDADWGSKAFTESRSVSAYCVFINGNLCHTGTKVQKVIALSSAESELMGTLLGVSEAIFVTNMVKFMCGPMARVRLVHYVDNSATRAIVQKDGLGRTRHIELGWLWIQKAHRKGVFITKSIPTKDCPADLQTKPHNRGRMVFLLSLMGMSSDEDGELACSVKQVKKMQVSSTASRISRVLQTLALLLETQRVEGCSPTTPLVPMCTCVLNAIAMAVLMMMVMMGFLMSMIYTCGHLKSKMSWAERRMVMMVCASMHAFEAEASEKPQKTTTTITITVETTPVEGTSATTRSYASGTSSSSTRAVDAWTLIGESEHVCAPRPMPNHQQPISPTLGYRNEQIMVKRRKFHRKTCGMVRHAMSTAPGTVKELSIAQATNIGLGPCKQCGPEKGN